MFVHVSLVLGRFPPQTALKTPCDWLVFPPDSQEPIHSDEQTDVLGRQAHRRQDQQHGHQAGTGNTGRSHTGQRGRHTGQEKEVEVET